MKGHKKTRKQTHHTARKPHDVLTIPALRRAFDHVEGFVEQRIHMSVGELTPLFQNEWKHVFHKELNAASARAYIENLKSYNQKHHSKRKTRKVHGGVAPVLDHSDRAGIYTIPASAGPEFSYAQVPKYVASGFWNPEPNQQYDPLPQQTRYVTAVPGGFGSVSMASGMKGGTRKNRKSEKQTRKLRRGGMASLSSLADAAVARIGNGMSPSTIASDIQGMWAGRQLPPSPDATDPSPRLGLTK